MPPQYPSASRSRPAVRLAASGAGVTAEQKAIWDRIATRSNAPTWAADASANVATARIAPPPRLATGLLTSRVPAPLSVSLDNEDDFPPLSGASQGKKGKHAPSPSLSTQTSQLTSSLASPAASSSQLEASLTGSTEVSGEAVEKMTPGEARPLDRFAAPFIPQWLRDIPPPHHRHTLPPRAPFPSPHYAAPYFSPHHLSSRPSLDTIIPDFRNVLPHKGVVARLDPAAILAHPDRYAKHFGALLSLAFQTQIEEARASTVYITPLRLHRDRLTTSLASTYRVHVSGVREDMPKLAIGDKLELRGLFPQEGWATQDVVEAEVVGLTKSLGHVYLRSDQLAMMDLQLPKDKDRAASYQIKFTPAIMPSCVMHDATRFMAMALLQGSDTAWRWVFPDTKHLQSASRASHEALMWYDSGLNEEQRAAVMSIARDHHTVPYLISGPPGTGKTKTIVEAILQILLTEPTAHILVCAPSNPAADTVAKRLARTLGPEAMFRLNAANRTFAEVPDILLPYCCIADDTFGLPTFERLMKYRVVVCGLLDSSILSQAHASNAELGRAVVGMIELQNLGHEGDKVALRPHWTHLLVDEAAQASEPETDIALSVVLPYHAVDVRYEREPIVVLCGDQYQLGPIISSQAARDGELDVSLLQRLFERDAYAKHPSVVQASRHLVDMPVVDGAAVCTPFTRLVQNYRSMPSILMVPSAMFYQDRLIPAARDVRLLRWSQMPNPHIPILFRGTESEEYCIDESWFNPGEIDTVVSLIKSLLLEYPDIQQKEIAVITPWREQVWRMRSRLREEELRSVDVGNVEAYQGGEFRVTILSCVRSNKRFLEEDRRTNMGFFNEPRRFNVAITRAKELLVVVGNANLLKSDPYWNGFLQIMLRNSLYVGPELEIEMTGAYISHIESRHRQASNQKARMWHTNGHTDDSHERNEDDLDDDGYYNVDNDNDEEDKVDQGLFLAGEMARNLLLDD